MLRKLRLLLGNKMSLVQLKDDIGGFTSLQVLSSICLNGGEGGEVEVIREIGKLTQLRKLGLFLIGGEYGISALSSSISNMQHLEKLRIRYNGEVAIDLNFISFSPMIQNVTLIGRLKRLPEGIPVLQNRIQLKLENSQLADNPLESLRNMPNLLILHLHDNAYRGGMLLFLKGEFHKPRELSITSLYKLNSIIIHKGALHSLHKLDLQRIPKLKMVPIGIQYLENLQVLNIADMSTKFKESIASNADIPHVEVYPR